MDNSFKPGKLLKNNYVQSIMASSKVRLLTGKSILVKTQKSVLLNVCGGGVELSGYYSMHHPDVSKGVVILLHGWEGSANSTYILKTAKYLYQNGYSVFRLNMRDHGENHYLNKGLFFCSMIDEVFEACHAVAFFNKDQRVFIAGFSLGGNFALRIAKKCIDNPIENLNCIFCISPVLDPGKSTKMIDENFFIRSYFVNKWKKSLIKKQKIFPRLYDFSELDKLLSLNDITKFIIHRYSDFRNIEEYFNSYKLVNDYIKDILVPTMIITSKDDPIIPVDDFYDLNHNEYTKINIQNFGGHNGFLTGLFSPAWYETEMLDIFDKFTAQKGLPT